MTRVFNNHQPKEVYSMETAKVDIRKLQLLNDRINQCIDALNQVRLSVHGLSQGLSHTSAQSGINPSAQFGFGQPGFGVSSFSQPYGQQGINPFGVGSAGFGQMPVQNPLMLGQNPLTQGFAPGLSHTTGLSPFSPFSQGVNPYLTGINPESLETTVRPIWADPFLTARITQTFPYAQFPVPPVVTIY
jgi:hypothetical protein